MMVLLAMSRGELSRFDTMIRVERGELRVTTVAGRDGAARICVGVNISNYETIRRGTTTI